MAWAQPPAGSEFRVNSYTTTRQFYSAVASSPSGDFVVVWVSNGQDGDSYGVFGQRFSASGTPQASEFRVNSYTTGKQNYPSVIFDASGNFVVVWSGNQQDGSGYGIFGQRFDAAGAVQGGEFRVNTYVTGNQLYPSVASNPLGDFVVVWQSGHDGSGYGIFGQRFDASGTPQGSEFQINTFTVGIQERPAVTADANGNFTVVWDSSGQDGSSYGIFGQRLNASGTLQGGEFRVNTYTTGVQIDARVAADANGNFVVVWSSNQQDGSSLGVFAQRFNAAGASQGSEFRVNTYTSNSQARPTVTSDESGNFVVVWDSNGQDGSLHGIFGQQFNSSGVPQGNEFRVNSYTTSSQSYPAVASSPDGDFVVVWNSSAQDGSSDGVFGQRYGDLIFEDGFESNDLTRWSSAQIGGGDLSVGGAAAMAGTSTGLQAVVNDTGALFVQDNTPNFEGRYRVRFYLDPNGFDPGESQSHFRTRILIAFDPSGLRVITLVLKRQLGAYTVEARVRRNDGTRADTGFFPITDAPHFIEFDWQKATGPGALDGSLQLWIDDISVATLTGIDNDQSAIDFVRMGALSIKTGAAGTVYYDQFESRRQRAIGPE
jgi:hypothetical protein